MRDEAILLVDSNAPELEALLNAFCAADYDVEAATTVEEAIEILGETTVAVAIVAVDSTDDRGYDLIGNLGTTSSQTECILLATGLDTSVLQELYRSGNVFSHHPRPPKDLSHLGMDVARAMELRHFRRQNSRLLMELRDSREDLQNQFEFLAQCEKLAAFGRVFNDLTDAMLQHLGEIDRSVKLMKQDVAATESNSHGDTHPGLSSRIQSVELSADECMSIISSAI